MLSARRYPLLALAILAAILSATACGGDNDSKNDSAKPIASPPAASPPNPKPSGTLGSAVVELTKAVPGDAFAVAFIDSSRGLWEYLTALMPVPMPAAQDKALKTELRKLLVERIGIDPSRSKAVVGFARPGKRGPTGAVLIGGVEGTLKGTTSGGDASLVVLDRSDQIVAAKKGDVVIVGPEEGVRAAFETLSGKRSSFPSTRGAFWAWVRQEAAGAFAAVAATADGDTAPKVRLMAQQIGLERALVTISSGGLRALAIGDQKKLSAAAEPLLAKLRAKVDGVEQRKTSAMAPDAPLGGAIESILQYHLMLGLWTHLQPKPTAGGLVINVPAHLGSSMTLTLLGVVGSVAAPAFRQYTTKARASEAEHHLGVIYEGVRSHYLRHRSLPPSASMTPAAGSCCSSPGGKCVPDPNAWDQPGWKALGFRLDQPHLYSYEFSASGQGFTVRAVGDLDCDGAFGTFELHGMVDSNGTVSGRQNISRINAHE